MDCLWITLADPEPAINGQLIYSKGLIESLSDAGANLCVLGLARSERDAARVDGGRLSWRLADKHPLPRWRRLWSVEPEIALRSASEQMHRTLDRVLRERAWD